MKNILILLIIISNLLSAPAYNAKREFKQADGTTFEARAYGNHILNWIEDENGEILKYNYETKNYDYAIIDENKLKASGYKYNKNNLNKSISKRAVKKIDKGELAELMKKRKALRKSTHSH